MRVTGRSALLAFAAVALALGNTRPSQASNILQYIESNPTSSTLTVSANAGGTVTTFTNNNNLAPPSIAVEITVNAAGGGSVNYSAYLNFSGFQSVDSVVNLGGGYAIEQFSGTMSFTSNANGTGTNFLTATFAPTYFSGILGTGALSSSLVPTLYTSTYYTIASGAANSGGIAISDISPGLSINNTTFAGFSGTISGNFAMSPTPPVTPSSTPEPSTIAGAVMAGVVAIGAGLRRRKAKVA